MELGVLPVFKISVSPQPKAGIFGVGLASSSLLVFDIQIEVSNSGFTLNKRLFH